jgi:hypothetical protein
MKIHGHVASFTPVARRGLLGLVASVVLLAAAACGTSAPGSARSTPLPCASLPGCTPPPTASSTGVPAGLPADWSTQAIHAATVALQTCARSSSLQPANCPQGGVVGGPALAVRWAVLNQPLDHAVAVPASQDAGTAAAGQVTVYGHFQMTVSYTTAGQAVRPYLDYVGGLAEASMTWDGHSFQNVQFVNSDAAAQPPVPVPPFTRPAEVTDANALAAVKAGFEDCATLQVPLTATTLAIPNCPQQYGVIQIGTITSAQWSINGDPTQGALVSFDTAHGNFAVTGSYHMDLHYNTNNGNSLSNDNGAHLGSASGNYTATLAWNGQQLTLLKITVP